jgi:hypothetical protein
VTEAAATRFWPALSGAAVPVTVNVTESPAVIAPTGHVRIGSPARPAIVDDASAVADNVQFAAAAPVTCGSVRPVGKPTVRTTPEAAVGPWFWTTTV